MAQKTDKEETEFKVVPETIGLCVKCGVSVNSGANHLCQSCFNSATVVSVSKTSPVASPGGTKEMDRVFGDESCSVTSRKSCSPVRALKLKSGVTSRDLKDEEGAFISPVKREVKRCSGCRRKVGLTGFKCRCGELFCPEHRYSDRHDCSYDYKTNGRATIARENPVIKAAKIVKI